MAFHDGIRKRNSLKLQFVSMFSLFIFISCGIISVMASFSILHTGEKFATEQGFPICAKTADYIDGDAFERISISEDTADPYYETARLWMLNLKNAVGCKYLYTMAPVKDTVFKYVIDGSCEPSDEENFSPIGTEEDLSSWGNAVFEVFKTGGQATSGLEEQEIWGLTISTYAAIKNSAGKVVGFVGCDFDIEFLIKTITHEICVIAGIGILCFLLGILLVWIFTNSIFGTMAKISQAMKQIAGGGGDLTARIPYKSSNELGMLALNCNNVIQSLDELVARLKKETGILSETGKNMYDQMLRNVAQISASSDNVIDIARRVTEQNGRVEKITVGVRNVEKEIAGLDDRISEQSGAIQQSSAAVEEISANIQSVTHSVSLIMDEYTKLIADSENGRHMQENVTEQIAQIAEQSKNLNEANTAITDIASKTNMLAMNAAIEAAHAGDAGKGFGVVADEIRMLAETSATQSTAINQLLAGIATAITEIVKSSKDSAASFDSVGTKITRLADLMREVQTGMQEESNGVKDILATMKTLDSTTQDMTTASSQMKNESNLVFNEIEELQHIAAETHHKSSAVAESMTGMKDTAETAVEASGRNREAARNVVDMITVFTVNEEYNS